MPLSPPSPSALQAAQPYDWWASCCQGTTYGEKCSQRLSDFLFSVWTLTYVGNVCEYSVHFSGKLPSSVKVPAWLDGVAFTANPFLIVTAPQLSACSEKADSLPFSFLRVYQQRASNPRNHSRPCGQGLWALPAVRTSPPSSPAQEHPLRGSLSHAESFMGNAALTISLGLHGSHAPALPSLMKPQGP